MNKVLLGLLLILVGGGAWYFYSQPETAPDETIRIGAALGLTGFASTWGEAERNAITLAAEELNSRPDHPKVEIIFEDTGSDNNKTLSAVQKLISTDRVVAIVGPSWLDSYNSAAPLADQRNVTFITPSATITAVQKDQRYNNIFSTWYRSDIQLPKFPSYLAQKSVKKLAIIATNDAFFHDVAKNLTSTLEKNGIELVYEEYVDPETSDMRTELNKIRQLQADAIFFGFNGEKNLVAFLTQRKTLGIGIPLYTTEYIEEYAAKAELRPLLVGTEFTAPRILTTNFHRKYQERFDTDPIFSASNAYDAVRILVEAIESGTTTGTDISAYLKSSEFDTVTFGKIRFDQIGGVSGGNAVVKKINANDISTVADPL